MTCSIKVIEYILNYADTKTVLRMRNLSKRSRGSVSNNIKNRKIHVGSIEDSRATVLNGRVLHSIGYSLTGCPKEPLSWVSDYKVTTEEQLTAISSVSDKIQCNFHLKSNITKPFKIDRVFKLVVNKTNCEFYANLEIERVDMLSAWELESEPLEKILKNIKSIKHLEMRKSVLNSDICKGIKGLEKFEIRRTEIKAKQTLNSITSFQCRMIKGIQNIYCPNLEDLDLMQADLTQDNVNWLSSMKKVKKFSAIYMEIIDWKAFLPTTLRYFNVIWSEETEYDFSDLTTKLPNLIHFNQTCTEIDINWISNSQVRSISSGLKGSVGSDFKPNLRKIVINKTNVSICNTCPQILAKCEWIVIDTEDFDLSSLPSGINRLECNNLSLESGFLIRPEKERRQAKECQCGLYFSGREGVKQGYFGKSEQN